MTSSIHPAHAGGADSTTLRCCVVDDEPIAAGLIISYIERTPSLTLAGAFSSASDAVKLILGGGADVVFLDIQMPQLNGVEFARIIPPECRVVFVTAYNNYAVEGFRVNALDYLLKPVSYPEFLEAVNRAIDWHGRRAAATQPQPQASEPAVPASDYIIVKSEYRLIQICVNDILYVEGLKDYVKIYVSGEQRPVITLMSMRALEQRLPASMFMRVHRSYIVNVTRIRVIERNRIVFGDHSIPVSDSYRQQFADYIAGRTVLPGEG